MQENLVFADSMRQRTFQSSVVFNKKQKTWSYMILLKTF